MIITLRYRSLLEWQTMIWCSGHHETAETCLFIRDYMATTYINSALHVSRGASEAFVLAPLDHIVLPATTAKHKVFRVHNVDSQV